MRAPGRPGVHPGSLNGGIADCFRHFPDMEVPLDDGCLGLRRDHPGQAVTPPRKPNKSAPADAHVRCEQARHQHSSDRITVENALADHKHRKQFLRLNNPSDTYRAIAGLASDRRSLPHPPSRTDS